MPGALTRVPVVALTDHAALRSAALGPSGGPVTARPITLSLDPPIEWMGQAGKEWLADRFAGDHAKPSPWLPVASAVMTRLRNRHAAGDGLIGSRPMLIR
jgi:hypothetical protein